MKTVAQEVASKSLATQLQQLDAGSDDDGTVTRMQLIEAIKRSASAGGEAAAAALVQRLDTERDGTLAIDEVERFLDRMAEASAKEVPAPAATGAAAAATAAAAAGKGKGGA